jgi:para-nitrobenzyl esterase
VTVVATRAGRVRGTYADAVHAFRGIPYARPPVGPLRFAAPVPHEPWDGVRDAIEFGPPPPQPMRVTPTDEWLTVNVWAPDPNASGLPVMVWLYGGRFTTGASDEPACDGARLASGGVVVVSLNYRVGPEGFMLIDGAIPNRGLLDQIAALHWVQENIAAFGGDPHNVTVFGQSAGAASVTMLMVTPAAAGLLRRGIAESVPAFLFGIDLAADVAAVNAAKLGCRPTLADLARVPPQQLADATVRIEYQDRWGYVLSVRRSQFGPVIDGAILPESPFRAVGSARDVELLIGHNRDEYNWAIGEDVIPLRTPSAVTTVDPRRTRVPDSVSRRRPSRAVRTGVLGLRRPDADPAHRAGARRRRRGHLPVRILFRRVTDRGGAHHRDPDGVRHLGFAHRLSALRLGAESRTTRDPEQASQQIWAGHPFDPFTLQR